MSPLRTMTPTAPTVGLTWAFPWVSPRWVASGRGGKWEEAAAAADGERLSGDAPLPAAPGPEGPPGVASHRIPRCGRGPALDPLTRRARERSEGEALVPLKTALRLLEDELRVGLLSPAAARGATGKRVFNVDAIDAVDAVGSSFLLSKDCGRAFLRPRNAGVQAPCSSADLSLRRCEKLVAGACACAEAQSETSSSTPPHVVVFPEEVALSPSAAAHLPLLRPPPPAVPLFPFVSKAPPLTPSPAFWR